MKILAIVGMPGSGKTTVLNYLKKYNIPSFNMGDIVTKIEPKKRGILETNEKIEHEIRTDLRKKLGPAAIAIRTAEEIKKLFKDEKIIAIGGIISPSELDYFKKEFGNDLFVICVDASPETRLARKRIREERPVTEDEFWQRENWQKSIGTEKVMAAADVHVDNEATLEELYAQLDKLLKRILSSH